MNVLVFGGAGYLGSAIVDALTAAGVRTLVSSRNTDSAETSCDITDPHAVARVCAFATAHMGPLNLIVHAASPRIERTQPGDASPTSQEAHHSVAVLGTEHLVHEALTHHVPQVVIITSAAAFADAENLSLGTYPLAKQAQEARAAALARTVVGRMNIFTLAPGFLPGGLNDDLPSAVRSHFASRDDGTTRTPHTIAHIIVSILTHPEAYPHSGRVDATSGALTPFH